MLSRITSVTNWVQDAEEAARQADAAEKSAKTRQRAQMLVEQCAKQRAAVRAERERLLQAEKEQVV